MMKIISCKIMLLLFIFLPNDHNWELKKQQDNIFVYTRRVDGCDFKQVKTITTVHASLCAVVKVITDVDNFKTWIYKCVESKPVKTVSDAELYHYQVTRALWPVADRDIVIHVTVSQDKKTKVVTIKGDAANDMVPPKNGLVRVKKFTSLYRLTPKKDGTVEIYYEMLTDPAGAIPAWIMNTALVTGPFNTQQKMNEQLQSSKYKASKLAFIVE